MLELISNAAIVGVKRPRGGVTAGPGPEADTRHCSHYGDVEEGGETVMKMGAHCTNIDKTRPTIS